MESGIKKENIFLVGPTGSGKTSRLIENYAKIVESGKPTSSILVLVMNRNEIYKWLNSFSFSSSGPINVLTYFGLVQRELEKYWPWVQEHLPSEKQVITPLFLTTETSHYLMEKILQKKVEKGYLRTVLAPLDRLAIEMTDNLNLAAITGLPFEEIALRLQGAWEKDPDKKQAFSETQEILQEYCQTCLENKTLDYGLAVELFNKHLLSRNDYRENLRDEFQYLIVDNLEETVPAAHDLISVFMEMSVPVTMAFSTDGGHRSFWGADPELALKRFKSGSQQIFLTGSYTCTQETLSWSQQVAEALQGQEVEIGSPGIQIRYFSAELRSEMIDKTANELVVLLKSGVKGQEIALISPFVDKVLEFSLNQSLLGIGYEIENISRSRRLIDRPYALALLTLTLLAHPEWEIKASYGDLLETFSLLLKVDPVRSALLAETVCEHSQLVPLEGEIRKRLGFRSSDEYDKLLHWVMEYQIAGEMPFSIFLEKVFGELLCPLSPTADDLRSCRQIIESALKFAKIVEQAGLNNEPVGKSFVEMLKQGTIAAETLVDEEMRDQRIILTTPYAYLISGLTTDYQVWLDTSGEGWFRSDAKELTNVHVLSRHWQGGNWTDQLDQKYRCQNAARTVKALLRHCRKGLLVAESTYSSSGYEQNGQLTTVLQDVTREVF